MVTYLLYIYNGLWYLGVAKIKKMSYMRPFEAGISPKFTIFDNKFIYAYVGLCISKLGLYAGIRIIIVMASFWYIFGRF